MGDNGGEYIKILFRPHPGGGAYPLLGPESLWALPRPDGDYELANIPFYAIGIACGDIIKARPDDNGDLVFYDVAEYGGHRTVRVICTDESGLERLEDFLGRGRYNWESADDESFYAIDCEKEQYERLHVFLEAMRKEGVLDFQVSA